MEAEEDLSYLHVSVLQAEDPHPERKGKNRNSVPEMRNDIYQKELTEGTPVRKAAARKKISISGPPQTIYGAGITERRSPFCGGYYI